MDYPQKHPAEVPEEKLATLTVEDALVAMGADALLDEKQPDKPAEDAVALVIPRDATHVRVKLTNGPSFPVTVQNGNEAATLKRNEETIVTRAIFNALRDSDFEFEARPV